MKRVHHREHRGYLIQLYLNLTVEESRRYEVTASKDIGDGWHSYKQWRGSNSTRLVEAAIKDINKREAAS